MKIIYTPKCLDYWQPGHPESPDRVRLTLAFLQEKGLTFTEPLSCSEKDILRVHNQHHWEAVKAGTFLDGDTPTLPEIVNHALRAAGGAIKALEIAEKEGAAFSLMRPPGHHATQDKVMGFCYFNNMAVAIAKFLHDNPTKKAAILDIDVHHGNGTEDIFLGSERILFASLHQFPLYPGTGLESRENILNFPLPPGTDEEAYLTILGKACTNIAEFHPDILGISAGFDTYAGDPLSQFGLESSSYYKMGQFIKKMNVPTFTLLEGGYSPELPICVYNFLTGLG